MCARTDLWEPVVGNCLGPPSHPLSWQIKITSLVFEFDRFETGWEIQ